MKRGISVKPAVITPQIARLPSESFVVLSLIALFFVAFAVYTLRPGGISALVVWGDVLYVLFAGVAAFTGFWAIRESGSSGPQGKLIVFLALAFVLDVIAGFVWMMYEVVLQVEPFPSVADWIWMGFYLLTIIGFSVALWRIRKFITVPQMILSFVVWGLVVALVSQSTLSLIFADTSYGFAEKFFSALYPIGDLVVILLVLLIFSALRKGVFGQSLSAFLLAFVVMTAADLIFSYQVWNGIYETGNLIDLFWLGAQLLAAYGFYLQVKAVRPQHAVMTKKTF